MGLPGHRRTSSDKRRRAAHFALSKQTVTACAKCASPVRPHYACAKCGAYAGREAIDTSRDVARLVKRAQNQAHEHAHEEAAPKKEEKEPEPKAEEKKASGK